MHHADAVRCFLEVKPETLYPTAQTQNALRSPSTQISSRCYNLFCYLKKFPTTLPRPPRLHFGDFVEGFWTNMRKHS